MSSTSAPSDETQHKHKHKHNSRKSRQSQSYNMLRQRRKASPTANDAGNIQGYKQTNQTITSSTEEIISNDNDNHSHKTSSSTTLAEADEATHGDENGEGLFELTTTKRSQISRDYTHPKQIFLQDSDLSFAAAAAAENKKVIVARDDVSKDEGRWRKMLTRIYFGLLMIFGFLLVLYMGHVYICGLIALVELLLFRELVKVRYNAFFHIIEETIPLFRTTQWMWFVVAIFYTYSDFVVEVIKSNPDLHYLLQYLRLHTPLAFLLYSGTFVLTIATMQTGHIKFQINQLCWTIVVLCLTVGQLKYIMHNVYNGLIWFTLPILLVVVNDIFAYFSGMTCGRKFIHRPFINLSPNKTWEGFIGGWIFTMVFGWYLSGIMAQYTWMTCPTNRFSLFPEKLDCDLDPIFHVASNIFPPQIFDIFPAALVKMIPGVVDICSVEDDYLNLTACVSGEPTHAHHHFELVVKGVFPIQIHALGLSMFASLVAPFGGFLASGIKRAYGIKDFDSIIPGHGGIMDRFDCQFLMALYTWVHYNTFVKMTTVSVPKMIYMYNLLKEHEQVEFLERITDMVAETRNHYGYDLSSN